ncbi:hypothetical protein LINPERHAP2_LOCUS9404 [Linum perenne]
MESDSTFTSFNSLNSLSDHIGAVPNQHLPSSLTTMKNRES